MNRVNHTCERRRAPSSVTGLVTRMSRNDGRLRIRAATVATPTTTTTRNALRQPKCSPSQAAIGTPATLATARPSMTCPIALARLPGPARCAATRAATPKYAPCGRPATNRAATSRPKDGASTVATLPTVKATIRPISKVRRDIRAVRAAMSGAPTTTPSAYAEITVPAVGSLTSRAPAILGNRPIATNSVVPIPKPPSASARIAQRSDVWRRETLSDNAIPRSSDATDGAAPVAGVASAVTAEVGWADFDTGGVTTARPPRIPADAGEFVHTGLSGRNRDARHGVAAADSFTDDGVGTVI